MNLRDYKIRKGSAYIFIYLCAVSVLFFAFVWGYFLKGNGESAIRFDADSFAYVELNEIYDSLVVLFSISPNFIGQIFLLRITDSNFLIIFLINLSLFILSYKTLIKSYDFDSAIFAVLLILNPLVIPVITTLNKEIFGMASVAFYASYLVRKKKWMFFLCLLFAVVTRWQMVFIILFFHFFRIITNSLKLSRGLSLGFFILLISITYPTLFAGFTNVIDGRTAERQQETAGALINFFNLIQHYYLYFVSVWPKMFFNLFGNFFRVFSLITNPSKADLLDVYNNVFLLGHQIITFALTVWMIVRKKVNFNNDLVYFCCVYLIAFSIGPMIQYRYIFPLYILFALIIAEQKIAKEESISDIQK
jgi:hypothetical protein